MSHCHSCARLVLAVLLAAGAVGHPEMSQATDSSTALISSGDLYVYGHRIASPYELVARDGVLSVNSVRIFPQLAPSASRDIDVAEDTRRRHELRERAFALQGELERAGETVTVITPRLAELLRAETALVDSVTGVRDDEFWVWWRGEPRPEQCLIREARERAKPAAPAEAERDLLRHALERDCLVIVTPNRRLIFPPDPPQRTKEVRAEIERARQASAGELTAERWPGRHFDHEAARLFQSPLELPTEE